VLGKRPLPPPALPAKAQPAARVAEAAALEAAAALQAWEEEERQLQEIGYEEEEEEEYDSARPFKLLMAGGERASAHAGGAPLARSLAPARHPHPSPLRPPRPLPRLQAWRAPRAAA
jgi:hypothetical protein